MSDLVAEIDDFNPEDLQDGLLKHVDNVHERYADWRARGGLLPGNPFTDETRTVNTAATGFTALSHAAVSQVLSDSEHFSTALYADIMGVVMGRTMLQMDGTEHRAHRLLATPAFRQKMLDHWRTELVEVVCDELISSFEGRGHAELVKEYTFAFPVQVIARMIGLPRADYKRFQRLSIELLNVVYDWDTGMVAAAALREYFKPILDARRREPRDDLISALAGAEIDGQQLTDEEIYSFLLLILPAGVETTYRSSGNLLVALLTHPHYLEEVRGNEPALRTAIEEGLRWEPPITALVRTCAVDTEVAGVPIRAGDGVNVAIASANRDEARFDNPAAFNPHRHGLSHLTFGYGPHMCLGMHLARMESAVALGMLFDRIPDLRLDPDRDTPKITGVAFRSPAAIPVRFTPS
ncbi:MAG TPA: cytochrome P450 [Mycobacteriales bacterium]|nr:cytochrome P450 [Mycobacteriales bacterium]